MKDPIEHYENPAKPFLQALREAGIALSLEDFCQQAAGVFALSAEAQAKVIASRQNRALIDALVAQIIQCLNDDYRDRDERAALKGLISKHEELFAARKELWTAIIKSVKQGRAFTNVELEYHQTIIDSCAARLKEESQKYPVEVQLRALCAHDRRLKDAYDLQFDEEMIRDINRIVGNVANSRPTLIVGEKGIAKTQIAKFVMGLVSDDNIVISVKGDMMSDELMGKIKHDPKENTFVFEDGPLLRAIKEGLPLLLDEINFGDMAIIARLQDILLKKPGDTLFVQESGKEHLTVQSGFYVFATANEASYRYRHREVLDPAIRDRFDVVIRTYPNLEGDLLTDTPASLLRLALSSAFDGSGRLSPHIDLGYLERFVRLVHVSEYLYAVPAKDVVLDLVEDEYKSVVSEESQPLMTDCITPRTLSLVIQECQGGNLPDRSLDERMVDRLLAALDQAGSSHNHELMQQARLLLDLDEGAQTSLSGAAVQAILASAQLS